MFQSLLDRIYQLTFLSGEQPLRYAVPLALVVGGFIVGFVFEKTVLRWLRKRASQNIWYTDDIIFDALRYVVTVWFGLIGVSLALYSYSLNFFDPNVPGGADANARLWEVVTAGLAIAFIVSEIGRAHV